jgi:hypothetical protein
VTAASQTVLAFVDTETTGLDPRIHQPYEVSWWREDQPAPKGGRLEHELTHADATALKIGRYWEREMFLPGPTFVRGEELLRDLNGVTLVGSNPAFDAAMLTRVIGFPVWHHRMIDVSNVAMVVFDWDRPKGLVGVVDACRDRGFAIPEPDHTAEGDVRATRVVYQALRAIRANQPDEAIADAGGER